MPTPEFAVTVLVLEFLVGAFIAALLLRSLPIRDGSIPWHVFVSVLVAWSFAIYIPVFLLPADLASAVRDHYEVPQDKFVILWRVAYWSTQVMTWIVLSIELTYVRAGDFTVKDRILRWGRENLRNYGIAALAGGVCVLYLLFKGGLSPKSLMGVLIGFSNMYGLSVFIAILGYGCVALPKQLWKQSHPDERLMDCQFRAARTDASIVDARSALAVQMNAAVRASRLLAEDNPLRSCIDVIMQKCPVDFDLESANHLLDSRDRETNSISFNSASDITKAKLVDLHRNLKRAVLALRRAKHEWNLLVEEAFDMEDVMSNRTEISKRFKSTLHPPRVGFVGGVLDRLEWEWKVKMRFPTFRALAVLFGIFSVIVVWSEVTIFSDKSLSPLSHILFPSMSYFGLQILVFMPLAYMVTCGFYTLFHLRLLSFVQIYFGNHTDGYSLVFNAGWCARLAAPLCFNFVNMLNIPPITAYHKIMKSMDAVPLLGVWVNNFFPCFIVLFSFFTLFNLWGKIARCLPFRSFALEDVMSEDLIQEGKRLLREERKRRERASDPGSARKEYRHTSGRPSPQPSMPYDRSISNTSIASVDRDRGDSPLLNGVDPSSHSNPAGQLQSFGSSLISKFNATVKEQSGKYLRIPRL
mmetsp:Transcript_6795/g.10613  ORF Transcript_6795/g.10613 Transcript_6795/m.10613 type:complete len:639 (+) Transcript_6795:108-2024(+)|eukprot:CAMPEP_0184664132 /NCGR_PEP_ID=MMETSP0308-20130426/51381_1 /TAXON_ID=38269 /ORGANISM="Gloeochaete witrockiana, Strain SAG 46.84" /LENGTH=638 /DNA_ID=CAMNT_0027107317 /DNA_START=12 /DNA_END=1928 /DNA_ORIENTATION=-